MYTPFNFFDRKMLNFEEMKNPKIYIPLIENYVKKKYVVNDEQITDEIKKEINNSIIYEINCHEKFMLNFLREKIKDLTKSLALIAESPIFYPDDKNYVTIEFMFTEEINELKCLKESIETIKNERTKRIKKKIEINKNNNIDLNSIFH